LLCDGRFDEGLMIAYLSMSTAQPPARPLSRRESVALECVFPRGRSTRCGLRTLKSGENGEIGEACLRISSHLLFPYCVGFHYWRPYSALLLSQAGALGPILNPKQKQRDSEGEVERETARRDGIIKDSQETTLAEGPRTSFPSYDPGGRQPAFGQC
jgi:hypothetical protein